MHQDARDYLDANFVDDIRLMSLLGISGHIHYLNITFMSLLPAMRAGELGSQGFPTMSYTD